MKKKWAFGLRQHLLFSLIFFLGCSTRLPVAGVEAYYSCDFEKSIQVFEEKISKSGKDYVLFNLAVLSASLRAGNDQKAETSSLNAQRMMWSDAGKERGISSLASAEAIKIFKGEPFEKAMVSIYSGIVYFNRKDYENARASFSKALLAVAQKEPPHQSDFALAHFLLAKVFLKLGEEDNAKISLEAARKIYPRNPFFDVKSLKKSNALFLFELGQVPQKVRTGPGGSLIDWAPVDYPEQEVSLSMNDKEIGWASEAGDLLYQAKTKGWTGKDTVQASKGIAREAAGVTTVIAAQEASRGNKTAGWVALGTGLFTLANQSQADTRQWELLPDRIFILPYHLSLGSYSFKARFYDDQKQPLLNLDQVWYYKVQSSHEDLIFLVRASTCSPNTNRAVGKK